MQSSWMRQPVTISLINIVLLGLHVSDLGGLSDHETAPLLSLDIKVVSPHPHQVLVVPDREFASISLRLRKAGKRVAS